jgi:hypothetical protein
MRRKIILQNPPGFVKESPFSTDENPLHDYDLSASGSPYYPNALQRHRYNWILYNLFYPLPTTTAEINFKKLIQRHQIAFRLMVSTCSLSFHPVISSIVVSSSCRSVHLSRASITINVSSNSSPIETMQHSVRENGNQKICLQLILLVAYDVIKH